LPFTGGLTNADFLCKIMERNPSPIRSAMKHLRSISLFSLYCATLILSLASCRHKNNGADTASLYAEAEHLYHQKHYADALDRYDRGLAADTLKGFSRVALDALCRKSRIEFLTGRYSAAFRTWSAIRRHGGGKLPDSLRAAVALDTSKMYAELGMYGKAASVMATISNPDAWQRFDEASLLFRAGNVPEASRIYGELAASDDNAIRMSGFSGLLDCSLTGKVSGLDTPDNLAGKIAMISGRVMAMDAPPEVRIRALRIAAKSLKQIEKQRPNASFLLFRALAIAQQSGPARLIPILQFESNNIIVRKPDAYRSVIEAFGQNNMTFAKAAALFMLGRSTELKPAERIEAYRNGLAACRYDAIPATAANYATLEREAAGELCDLLTAAGRYTELFDASAFGDFLEQQRLIQANISEFRLPPGHEALQNEIIELTLGISGLLQRKIDMIEEGSGFGLSTIADSAVREKQGRLIQLMTAAAKVDATLPARLQPQPVTLRTLQKSLRPDQALIRCFVRDSLSTIMLVSGQEMQIVTARTLGVEVAARFATLRQRLVSAGTHPEAALSADEDRLWLTKTLLQSIGDRMAGYRHLIFVSPKAEPLHLLGRTPMLGRDHEVSYLVSMNEALAGARVNAHNNAVSSISFFDASTPQKAQIHKLLHPGDHVFLSFTLLPEQEITALKTGMKKAFDAGARGPDILKKTDASGRGAISNAWIWLGSYGSE
jgi:tetratricopeptide (TPR) repeat protein